MLATSCLVLAGSALMASACGNGGNNGAGGGGSTTTSSNGPQSGAGQSSSSGPSGSGPSSTSASGASQSSASSSASSSGAGGAGGGPPLNSAYDCSAPTGALPNLKLTQVAAVKRPALLIGAPKDDQRLFILGQDGKIYVLLNGTIQPTPFLDISKIVHQPAGGDERGLLGLAFHPSYETNHRFFVYYTDITTKNQVLAEYASSNDPNVAKPDAIQVLFSEPDPEANHNGGTLAFSPNDGFLYIGMGDGGGAGDKHGAFGNGQNLATKWGKILRIDVSSTPYTIPAGNLTVVPPGNPTTGPIVPEIWDYGLRNPWRFSFDACTGDLYIGDVGQGTWEEIDVEPAGQGKKNYGWRLTEGNHDFNPETYDKSNITPAVDEYDHSNGTCSVSGGFVYRGSAIPALRGTYLYADYCSGQVWSFVWSNGSISQKQELTGDLGTAGFPIVSFGQDNKGEVYVVSLAGQVYRIDAE